MTKAEYRIKEVVYAIGDEIISLKHDDRVLSIQMSGYQNITTVEVKYLDGTIFCIFNPITVELEPIK